MQVPLQVSFRNLAPSPSIRDRIRERVSWLEGFFGRIISCRVAVEIPHRHHRRGNLYRVRIDLRIPGGEIVVTRSPGARLSHRDLYVVIRDAFDEARRMLEQRARRMRREVKTLEQPAHAVVIRLVEQEGGYGFLRDERGRELYFNPNSVLAGGFSELEVGAEVRFAEELGDHGLQASSVERVGRQGRRFTRDLKRSA